MDNSKHTERTMREENSDGDSSSSYEDTHQASVLSSAVNALHWSASSARNGHGLPTLIRMRTGHGSDERMTVALFGRKEVPKRGICTSIELLGTSDSLPRSVTELFVHDPRYPNNMACSIPEDGLWPLFKAHKSLHGPGSYTGALRDKDLSLLEVQTDLAWPGGKDFKPLVYGTDFNNISKALSESFVIDRRQWVLRNKTGIVATFDTRVCEPYVAQDIKDWETGLGALAEAEKQGIVIQTFMAQSCGSGSISPTLVFPGTGDQTRSTTLSENYHAKKPSRKYLSDVIYKSITSALNNQDGNSQGLSIQVRQSRYKRTRLGLTLAGAFSTKSFDQSHSMSEISSYVEEEGTGYTGFIEFSIIASPTDGESSMNQVVKVQFFAPMWNNPRAQRPSEHTLMLGRYLLAQGDMSTLTGPVEEVEDDYPNEGISSSVLQSNNEWRELH
ncbi:hypothetical protein M231_02421 [Tremella mesenterica]|uniref:Uncharacterized protein n=1 Tax=Tremella mesenterica TaxID=5217 RepID=A0A4V1M4G7_TREME|nr:hypothetical protein M231_02421 [Tremella mesenterica]